MIAVKKENNHSKFKIMERKNVKYTDECPNIFAEDFVWLI